MNSSRKMLKVKARSHQWCTYPWQLTELFSISIRAQPTSDTCVLFWPIPTYFIWNRNLDLFQVLPLSGYPWSKLPGMRWHPSISLTSKEVPAFPAVIFFSLLPISLAAGGFSTHPSSKNAFSSWLLLSQVLDPRHQNNPYACSWEFVL